MNGFRKQKSNFRESVIRFSLPLLFVFGIIVNILFFRQFFVSHHKAVQQNDIASSKNVPLEKGVLGRNTQAPHLYLYGGDHNYSSGGMIALASTDEPAVYMGSYNISGNAEIQLYKANEDALLDYLTHDKEGKQTKKTVQINKFQYITTITQDLKTNNSKITLPLDEMGIWYIAVKAGNAATNAFVVRSSIAALVKEGDDEFIFWGQDLKSKKSLTDSMIILYNLQDTRKELARIPLNYEGLAKAKLRADADIALIAHQNDRAVIPINLRYLNIGYSYAKFQPNEKRSRYFVFTDRPLYKPGDTVYFKAVLRDDDDARYSIPTGEASVKVFDGYYYEGSDEKPLSTKTYPVSPDGTVNGEYKIPENGKTGQYSLAVILPDRETRFSYWDYDWSTNVASFDVEFFRKPEYSIDVTTPKTEIIAGDKNIFTISGSYFSGQPLIGQKVSYSVHAADFYEYQYLSDKQYLSSITDNDYRYGFWYGGKEVMKGTVTLDKNGKADIELDTKMNFNKGKSQIFSVEATVIDGTEAPSFSRKNILVYAGEYGIYRKDYSYGTKVNKEFSMPITLVPNKSAVSVGDKQLTAKVQRINWKAFQEPDKKYVSYKKEVEDLPEIKTTTNKEGNTALLFTPEKTGSYNITIESEDDRGNVIAKEFYMYVTSEDESYYSENSDNDLTITGDKQKYQPGETAVFTIFSTIPDRDVFLSMQRGRVDRYKIVHLDGKTGTIQIPLKNTDTPNIYADIDSFSSYDLDSNSINVPVSTDSKKLKVVITPNSKTFGPGETATVDISTTDIKDSPVSADVALWAVDKAIFELSDDKLGNIFDTFWKERNNTTQQAHSLEGILVNTAEGGGCFAKGTTVLMSDGTRKNIEDVKSGDFVLTRRENDTKLVSAKVLKTHNAQENGYLIINSNLKVTANHIIRVNGEWKEAGSVQIGDSLINSQGKNVTINSIEWQRGKFTVYNLEIEKYHTYFADGVWVHNQKGTARNAFKDTAYWNPSIHTNSEGKAQIRFTLPDNLTTWTVAGVGATEDTRVGQTTTEIVVTKDIIVRPIVPNILRTDDDIIVGAIVQNFTGSTQKLDVDLTFDSGNVEEPVHSDISLNTDEMRQFNWKIKPSKENEKAKLIFSARSKDDAKLADVVTQGIPVRKFGFEETNAQTGDGVRTFKIKLAPDNDESKSAIKLSLSPTVTGPLITAMNYLIAYPYGCVEQTTSRFVPAVIAKVNQDMFAEALKDKNIDDMIKKGLERLKSLQQDDGGWAWWSWGRSDMYITAYVVEYILQAQQTGINVDQDMLDNAQRFLETDSYFDSKTKKEVKYSREDMVVRNYALTLLGEKTKVKKVIYLANLSPDILSLAVMTNYLNGDTNPQSNGLQQLLSSAQNQGDAIFWESGEKNHFGSRDASTALAIRAIILAKGDRSIAAKAAQYLIRNRHTEYWSNTYATAQVSRALVELAKTGSELSPNYTYTVTLDGQAINQGKITDSKQNVNDITIPVSKIKTEGSDLAIMKTGDGQIYSTLFINEFHTDKHAPAVNHGLNIKREYINEKGEEYGLEIGDTAIVKLTISGLKANEQYGVIKDELPAGLIPINQNLKNEQYANNRGYDFYYYMTGTEITENGAVLSLYNVATGEHSYTYKARVISDGTFSVPPATVSLMYAPEISGRSEAQTLTIPMKAPEPESLIKKVIDFFTGNKKEKKPTPIPVLNNEQTEQNKQTQLDSDTGILVAAVTFMQQTLIVLLAFFIVCIIIIFLYKTRTKTIGKISQYYKKGKSVSSSNQEEKPKDEIEKHKEKT